MMTNHYSIMVVIHLLQYFTKFINKFYQMNIFYKIINTYFRYSSEALP